MTCDAHFTHGCSREIPCSFSQFPFHLTSADPKAPQEASGSSLCMRMGSWLRITNSAGAGADPVKVSIQAFPSRAASQKIQISGWKVPKCTFIPSIYTAQNKLEISLERSRWHIQEFCSPKSRFHCKFQLWPQPQLVSTKLKGKTMG